MGFPLLSILFHLVPITEQKAKHSLITESEALVGRGMVQSVCCLLCNHEDQSSTSGTHGKPGSAVCTCDPARGRRRCWEMGKNIPGTWWPASLSRIRILRTLFQKQCRKVVEERPLMSASGVFRCLHTYPSSLTSLDPHDVYD